MKLSTFAKQLGVTYKTAWQWCKDRRMDGYQLPNGTVNLRGPRPKSSEAARYARLSSANQR